MNTSEGAVARFAVEDEAGIVASRQAARDLARTLGFSMVDQSRIATAVSELVRNVVRYATDARGEVTIREIEDHGRRGIEIVVADEGPGIPDLEVAMRDGYTSGPGLGLGLPGTRRLMDYMDIDTGVDRGTIVTIRKYRG